MFLNSILQSVPELQNLFRSISTLKSVQRITQETGHNAILVILIHHITLGAHVLVDQHRQTVRTGVNIQPPVSVWVFHWVQFIGDIAVLQKIRPIPIVGQSQTFQHLGQLFKRNGREGDRAFFWGND